MKQKTSFLRCLRYLLESEYGRAVLAWALLIAMLALFGCRSQQVSHVATSSGVRTTDQTTTENHSTATRITDSTLVTQSVLQAPIPADSAAQTLASAARHPAEVSDTSRLQTNVAASLAWWDPQTGLHHTLWNRTTQTLPVVTPPAVSTVRLEQRTDSLQSALQRLDSVRTDTLLQERIQVEVPREWTFWEKVSYGFRVFFLGAAIGLGVGYFARKKLNG